MTPVPKKNLIQVLTFELCKILTLEASVLKFVSDRLHYCCKDTKHYSV